ncbi:DUF1203 domain-containing protein [Streptomyces sp. NPDC000618]|uniref:DUF1203 domain-containing protein n=1 Tax=Streptomyces sp. NPDC000618 TaxID=3154265 RepID=UPI0033281DEC
MATTASASTSTTASRDYTVRAVPAAVLDGLRVRDDAGCPVTPFVDHEGGAPLRCCLRRSAVGERIALVSYAPLRRWAAETGVEPGAYDEQGPVFVHAESEGCTGPGPGAAGAGFPFGDAHRTVRRYSGEGRILGGALVDAGELDAAFREAFDGPDVVFVHVRAVEYGCFLYEVRR